MAKKPAISAKVKCEPCGGRGFSNSYHEAVPGQGQFMPAVLAVCEPCRGGGYARQGLV